jgi:hypothetical protein
MPGYDPDHPNQLVLFESGEKKAMVANRPRYFFKIDFFLFLFFFSFESSTQKIKYKKC